MVLYYILTAVFGLCIGSFINVLLYRLDRQEGIVTGRSRCRNCSTTLAWYDLIPVLSFLALKGRCRYCQKRISPLYPIVELSTAIAFFAMAENFQFPIYGLRYLILNAYFLIIVASFVALFFFDYLYLVLPDKITLPLIGLTLVYDIAHLGAGAVNPILCGLTLAGVFAILYGISGGKWMGFGDVKLILLIGLLFGFPLAIIIFIFSTWLATIFGLTLLALKKATLKTALPFGSFLTLTSLIFLIFENGLSFFTKIF